MIERKLGTRQHAPAGVFQSLPTLVAILCQHFRKPLLLLCEGARDKARQNNSLTISSFDVPAAIMRAITFCGLRVSY